MRTKRLLYSGYETQCRIKSEKSRFEREDKGIKVLTFEKNTSVATRVMVATNERVA